MARKSKAKKNTSLLHWLQEWTRTDSFVWMRKKTGMLALLGAAAVTLVLGFRYLDGYVHRIAQAREVSLTVSLKNPPRWAGEELIEMVCLSSGIRSDDFLLEKDLTPDWVANLERNPWIRKVNRIRKFYNGRVELDCEFRQPIASVKQHQQTYYLDPEGVVLPYAPVSCHLIRLDGIHGSIPEPGGTISNSDGLAGLEVLTKILQMDEQLPRTDRIWNELAVLDVSNYEGRISSTHSHLTLFTNNMTEIRWGAAVGRSLPFHEADFKYKLSTLYRTFKKFRSLDTMQYVDLRDWPKEKADPLRKDG